MYQDLSRWQTWQRNWQSYRVRRCIVADCSIRPDHTIMLWKTICYSQRCKLLRFPRGTAIHAPINLQEHFFANTKNVLLHLPMLRTRVPDFKSKSSPAFSSIMVRKTSSCGAPNFGPPTSPFTCCLRPKNRCTNMVSIEKCRTVCFSHPNSETTVTFAMFINTCLSTNTWPFGEVVSKRKVVSYITAIGGYNLETNSPSVCVACQILALEFLSARKPTRSPNRKHKHGIPAPTVPKQKHATTIGTSCLSRLAKSATGSPFLGGTKIKKIIRVVGSGLQTCHPLATTMEGHQWAIPLNKCTGNSNRNPQAHRKPTQQRPTGPRKNSRKEKRPASDMETRKNECVYGPP